MLLFEQCLTAREKVRGVRGVVVRVRQDGKGPLENDRQLAPAAKLAQPPADVQRRAQHHEARARAQRNQQVAQRFGLLAHVLNRLERGALLRLNLLDCLERHRQPGVLVLPGAGGGVGRRIRLGGKRGSKTPAERTDEYTCAEDPTTASVRHYEGFPNRQTSGKTTGFQQKTGALVVLTCKRDCGNGSGMAESTNVLKPLPDAELCRTKRLGLSDLWDCLLPSPFKCKYAVSFGRSFFCNHPERHSFEKCSGPDSN